MGTALKPGEIEIPAKDALHRAQDAARHVGDRVADGYGVAKDAVIKATSQTEDFIRANPLVAVLAATGLGWLIGRAIARSVPDKVTKETP